MSKGRFTLVMDNFNYLGNYISPVTVVVALMLTTELNQQARLSVPSITAYTLVPAVSPLINAKRPVYTSVIPSMLLYGCECWSLTECLDDRLRLFHAQCVRVMTSVGRKSGWAGCRRHCICRTDSLPAA